MKAKSGAQMCGLTGSARHERARNIRRFLCLIINITHVINKTTTTIRFVAPETSLVMEVWLKSMEISAGQKRLLAALPTGWNSNAAHHLGSPGFSTIYRVLPNSMFIKV
jgi:hypothetical protein